MKLERLGERKIIEIIQKQLDVMPQMPIPFGDDASAYDIGNGNLAVLKTDMLVDKTDIPKGMSLWQAARKAVVMNISDFAAKGVEPKTILVSLGLPRRLSEEDIIDIANGLNAGAREYNAYIIGGDTGEASDLIISISLFGTAKKNALMLRSGAKPGDLVAVTGSFGKSATGLKILLNGFNTTPEMREALVDSVLMPHARLKEGLILSQTKAVTAAIDSSDGLAWSLHELAKASRIGFLIDKFPIAEEAEKFARLNGLDPSGLTLYGGEEYELVLTIKPSLWRKAKKAIEKAGGELLLIGKATSKRQLIIKINGKRNVIEPRGWEHFKNSNV